MLYFQCVLLKPQTKWSHYIEHTVIGGERDLGVCACGGYDILQHALLAGGGPQV